jgi:hypothetical protein
MNDDAHSDTAVNLLRMLLIKNGLEEELTDAFLQKLRAEIGYNPDIDHYDRRRSTEK